MKRLWKSEGNEGTGDETETTLLDNAPSTSTYSTYGSRESRQELHFDSISSQAQDAAPSGSRQGQVQFHGQYESIGHQGYGRCRRWMLSLCEVLLRFWNILLWPYNTVMERVQPAVSDAFLSVVKKEQHILFKCIGPRGNRLLWIAVIYMLWGVLMICLSVFLAFRGSGYFHGYPLRGQFKTQMEVKLMYFAIMVFEASHCWLIYASCKLVIKIKELLASLESSRSTQHTSGQSAVVTEDVSTVRSEEGAGRDPSVETEPGIENIYVKKVTGHRNGEETEQKSERGFQEITAFQIAGPQSPKLTDKPTTAPAPGKDSTQNSSAEDVLGIVAKESSSSFIDASTSCPITGRYSDVVARIGGRDSVQDSMSTVDAFEEVSLSRGPVIAGSSTNLNSGQESSVQNPVQINEDDDVELDTISEETIYPFPPTIGSRRTLIGIPRQLVRNWLLASCWVHFLYIFNTFGFYQEDAPFISANFLFITVAGIGPILDATAEYYKIEEDQEDGIEESISMEPLPSGTTQ